MSKITFLKYYKMQFKDVPKIWKLAKINKAWVAFILTMLTLFNACELSKTYFDKQEERFKKFTEQGLLNFGD